MKRYSRTQSKDRIKDFSKDYIKDLDTTEKGINIQIFNVTGRHRSKLNKTKRDRPTDIEDYINLSKHDKLKQRSCALQRKAKENNVVNSSYGPIVPDYSVLKKREVRESSKKLKQSNTSLALSAETAPTMQKQRQNFVEDKMSMEDMHYEMVKFQQKYKEQLIMK